MHTVTSAADELDAHALQVRVRELESLLKISEARCAKLEYKLQDLLRRIFDPKNEKLNPAQRALFGLPEAGASASPVPTTAASGTSTDGLCEAQEGRRTPPPSREPPRASRGDRSAGRPESRAGEDPRGDHHSDRVPTEHVLPKGDRAAGVRESRSARWLRSSRHCRRR